MNKRYFIFILTLICSTCFGQKQGNIWYFGENAGLDFNSGAPVPIIDGQTYFTMAGGPHNEGSSVICDSSGSLLFYSNGQKVWNRNHTVMPNGDSLLGHTSSTQSALIVPQPLSDRYFYLFTTDAFVDDYLQYGIRYSIVDICLDNGFGDIVSGSKNILLQDTVAEKLAVVKHANGTDYWIVTHKYWSDAFYAFHLTSNGIANTVVSHIGSMHHCIWNLTSTTSAIGQLKISTNGNKLALCFSNCNPGVSELFDFSTTTGIVSNYISLPGDSVSGNLYGVEFSPDNSKLYFTGGFSGLYQYDLTAGGGNADSIRNSKALVADPVDYIFGMQLAPDEKIYVANWNQSYLSVITDPNINGIGCNYINGAISLNGKLCSYGIPGFITNYNYSNNIVDCSVGLNENSSENLVSVFPNPFQGQLNISMNDYQDYELNVYDIVSRRILEQKFMGSISLNTELFANGIYIYEVKSLNRTIARGKAIKN